MILQNNDIKSIHWNIENEYSIVMACDSWDSRRFICVMDDNTIQQFFGFIDETSEGEIIPEIYCLNEEYDNIDRIVWWVEAPDVKPRETMPGKYISI
jgi:hypothetical protein